MPRMNKLSLAYNLISKEERDQIIESIKRKDGSVPMRTFIREAFYEDRYNTAMHEAGHAVIGLLCGSRLSEKGVRINNPRHGEYCRGGSCNWIAEPKILISVDVMRLQAGRLAENKPVSEDEATEALAWLGTTLAMDLLLGKSSSDLTLALRSLKAAYPIDQVVPQYMQHQKAIEELMQRPTVMGWVLLVCSKLYHSDTGILSHAQVWDLVGERMGPSIEAMAKILAEKVAAARWIDL